MVRTIPLYGNPNGQVFGAIGSLIEMADGLKYVKVESDSLNTGWESYNATPTPTPTPTATPTPTITPTPTSTPTPSPTPTVSVTPTPTATPTPTPTPTISGGVRVLSSINPPQYGRTTWDLDILGPLIIYDSNVTFYSTYCFISFDINGAFGGNGGWDASQGGNGGYGNRMICGMIMQTGIQYTVQNGSAGSGGGSNVAGSGGGVGGNPDGGYGGNAGPVGVSGGGGGGGGTTTMSRNGSEIIYVGGGGGGGGGGLYSSGGDGYWAIPSWGYAGGGSPGDSEGEDGGGGGGGGGNGGSGGASGAGDTGGSGGSNGGSYANPTHVTTLAAWQIPSTSTGNGFTKLY